jgi:hypothetical protein
VRQPGRRAVDEPVVTRGVPESALSFALGFDGGGTTQGREHVLGLRTPGIVGIDLCIEDGPVAIDHEATRHRERLMSVKLPKRVTRFLSASRIKASVRLPNMISVSPITINGSDRVSAATVKSVDQAAAPHRCLVTTKAKPPTAGLAW